MLSRHQVDSGPNWKKSIHFAEGLCRAIVLKFWRSGQCGKIFPMCYAAYKAITHIKLICKLLIYT